MKIQKSKSLFTEALHEGISDFARQEGYTLENKENSSFGIKNGTIGALFVALVISLLCVLITHGN